MFKEAHTHKKRFFFSFLGCVWFLNRFSSSWCYLVEWDVSTVKEEGASHSAKHSIQKKPLILFVSCLLFSTDPFDCYRLLLTLSLSSSRKDSILLRVKTTISSVDSHDRLKRVESQWHSINKKPSRLLLLFDFFRDRTTRWKDARREARRKGIRNEKKTLIYSLKMIK